MASFRRIPFATADADAVAAFCVAAGGPFDGALVRRLVLELTSDASGVFVIAGDDGLPVLVATVIDRGENAADAARLEVLGVGAPVPAEAFATLVVAPGIAFARAGKRRVLHVEMHEFLSRVADAERTLTAAGFEPAYALSTMVRRGDVEAPTGGAPVPDGWRWVSLDDARVAAAHALLTDAFRESASFILSPLETFRRTVASGVTTWRALLQGETVAGLVHVSAAAPRAELRTVARAPAYRGRGIGARLVEEGLRLLLLGGPRDISLDVQADNDRALDLYRRFGFEVTARTPVLGLALRRGV